MNADDKSRYLAVCMSAICDKLMSRNPAAWFDLEQEGHTRESMKKRVDAGEWLGPPPVFENAPDRDDPMWQFMLEQAKEIL